MFGMGFTEILIIGVIAILFLGPDKLPEAMVEIAKMLKNLKRTISSAKDSIESELHVSEMKEEMMSYKRELTSSSEGLSRLTSMDDLQSEIDDIKKDVSINADDIKETPTAPSEPEVVTFKKKKKKKTVKTDTDISDTDV
jgi:sec-independent protein translocase protein TatB